MDKTVFKSLYIELLPSITIFIYSKCLQQQLAEDIAQESFLRLWSKRDEVIPEKAKSFLFTVSNNLFLDHVRHHKVIQKYVSLFSVQQSDNDPHYNLVMKEFKEKLDTTIQAMPERNRQVFLMNRIEKMTYKEIASHLDLTTKAIEKRMQKALEFLVSNDIGKI